MDYIEILIQCPFCGEPDHYEVEVPDLDSFDKSVNESSHHYTEKHKCSSCDKDLPASITIKVSVEF